MSPQRKGIVPPAETERVQAAVEWKKAADLELVNAVVDAMRAGGSIAEVAAISGLSERTIIRWRQGKNLPTAEELREARRREDHERSIAWFRENAPLYGIDPDNPMG